MLQFLKKTFLKPSAKTDAPLSTPTEDINSRVLPTTQPDTTPAPEQTTPKGWFKRLKQKLSRSRQQFTAQLSRVFLGRKTIDADLFIELERILLSADLGFDLSQRLLKQLSERVSRKQLKDPMALMDALKTQLLDILQPCEQGYPTQAKTSPFVIMMIGVNGAGKTTTIGKMAKQFQAQGLKVMLAAGDTFRAAAVEQLKVWGERNQIPVVYQERGADSASVIFDALQSAKAKACDILLADTAGRLHNKQGLMEELKKMQRVLKKQDPDAPHEVLLVLDAGIGQNAIQQAKEFHQALGVTGLIITKLDGTAKGGAIFAIASELSLPIRFLGVGEGIEDLRPFSATEFVDALFELDDTTSSETENS